MSTDTTIHPCHACNSRHVAAKRAENLWTQVPEPDAVRVHCSECGTFGPAGRSQSDAVRRWNRWPGIRADPASVELVSGVSLAELCTALGPYIQKIHDNADAFLEHYDKALNWCTDSVYFQAGQCIVLLRYTSNLDRTYELALSIDELQEWLDSLEAPDGHNNS